MDPGYERQLLAAEEEHYWFRVRRRIIRDLLGSLPLAHEPRLLDAGTGGGRTLEDLARFGTVTGLEPSEQAHSKAERRGVGTVALAPLERMPFEPGSFDVVTCLDVIEHVEDDVAGFAALRAVSAPGAFMIVTVPAYPWLWSQHDRVNHHHRRYDRSSLLSATASAGWQPLRTSYFNSVLLPAAMAYRLLERAGVQRLSGTSTKVLTETPAWLNRALELPLLLEAALLRRGVDIPAGLSLLGLFRAAEPA
jgi:2-polyprenyl-3-methyl-5-hydroxy-6-metoxy-1,4-benzoquinol methylase